MNTPYSDIYDLFSGMVSDYEFLQLPVQTQDDILEGWLLNSIGEFSNCKKDLNQRDNVNKQFLVELDSDEKTILAKYMLAQWLSPKLYSIDMLRMHLTSKDFNTFSPANFIKELRELHQKARCQAESAKMIYSYRHFDPSKELK